MQEQLHVKDVHYKAKCPHSCNQQPTCARIRDVDRLLKDVMKKMGEEYPIFENVPKFPNVHKVKYRYFTATNLERQNFRDHIFFEKNLVRFWTHIS